MKYITAASEKRIMKAVTKNEWGFYENDNAGVLAQVLDNIKTANGCLGITITEAKKYGVEYDNAPRTTGYGEYTRRRLRGWAINYPDLVYYTDTLDLDCLYIYDFNKLVKTLLGA